MSDPIHADLSIGTLGLLLDRWKVDLQVSRSATTGQPEVVLTGFGSGGLVSRTTTGPSGSSTGTILVLALKEWRDTVRGGRP